MVTAYSTPDVVDQTYLSTIESVFEKKTGAKRRSIHDDEDSGSWVLREAGFCSSKVQKCLLEALPFDCWRRVTIRTFRRYRIFGSYI